MTKRSSLRVQARAILQDEMQASNLRASAQAPAHKEPSLTERVRALFENSIIPVAEIARLAGVTERTIYKYAARHRWKPRYRWQNGKAGERHRRWQPSPEFVPVKGAGGRFVARAETGKPFAVGLKATDPAGAALAGRACADAAALSAKAERQVRRERQAEEGIGAILAVKDALVQFRKQEYAWNAAHAGDDVPPLPEALALALRVSVALPLRRWEIAMDTMRAERFRVEDS